MGPRAEHVRFYRCGIDGAQRVFHAEIRFIEGLVRIAANAAVRIDQQHIIGTVRQLHLAAVFVRYRPIIEIHIRKHGENVVRSGKRLLRHGKQTLLLGRERMITVPVDIRNVEPKRRKPLFRGPAAQRLLRNGQNLRLQKRSRRLRRNHELDGAVGQSLIRYVAVVFILMQLCIMENPFQQPPKPTFVAQRVKERIRALRKFARMRRERANELLHRRIVRLPVGFAAVDFA